MTWTVRWTREARDQLAAVWLAASDRAAVTHAAHRIEAALRRDPTVEGESRDAGRRLVIDYPLAVMYRVNDIERKVRILGVRACRRRS
jgi:hypothetical protein